MNTHYDLTAERGGEILLDPEALRAWFTARGLVELRHHPDTNDLARAKVVREGLRALAFLNNGQSLNADALAAMQRASAGAGTEIRIERDGPRFVPLARGTDAAIGTLLAITARAMIDGSWLRFKACPGRGCGWAFYDHSRNQSARWCSMKVCGDRRKPRLLPAQNPQGEPEAVRTTDERSQRRDRLPATASRPGSRRLSIALRAEPTLRR